MITRGFHCLVIPTRMEPSFFHFRAAEGARRTFRSFVCVWPRERARVWESRRSNFIRERLPRAADSFVRSSARSSFHKHIYRQLDALQWRFNLANAFRVRSGARGLFLLLLLLSLSLSLSLSRACSVSSFNSDSLQLPSLSAFSAGVGSRRELFPSRATSKSRYTCTRMRKREREREREKRKNGIFGNESSESEPDPAAYSR